MGDKESDEGENHKIIKAYKTKLNEDNAKKLEQLVKLRKDLNISQEELSNKCGISRQTISKWENGESVPSMKSLKKVCKALNIPIASIFTGDEKQYDEYINYARDGAYRYREECFENYQTIEENEHFSQYLYSKINIKINKRALEKIEIVFVLVITFFAMLSGISIYERYSKLSNLESKIDKLGGQAATINNSLNTSNIVKSKTK